MYHKALLNVWAFKDKLKQLDLNEYIALPILPLSFSSTNTVRLLPPFFSFDFADIGKCHHGPGEPFSRGYQSQMHYRGNIYYSYSFLHSLVALIKSQNDKTQYLQTNIVFIIFYFQMCMQLDT